MQVLTARPPRARLAILAGVGALAILASLWLYRASERWVPEADARVRAAQARQRHDALHALEAQADRAPGDGAAQTACARALVDAGAFVPALFYAERATQAEPRSAQAHLLQALILSTLDYRREADEHYRRAIALDPDNLEGYQRRGDFLAAIGRSQEAASVFRAALERAPDAPGPRMSLAGVLRDQGRARAALEMLEPLLARQDAPVAALFIAGRCCQDLSRTKRALDLLGRAVAAAPDFADARHVLGALLSNQGRPAEGIPHLQKAVELSPGAASYHYALGNAYRSLRDDPDALNKARAAFERALELDPATPIVHYFYGLTLEELGETASAAREYRRTLELEPKFGSARYRLGAAYRTLGMGEEARRLQEEFARQQKQEITQVHGGRRANSFVDTAEAHFQRGRAFLEEGDRVRAAAAFRTALDRDPGFGPARAALRSLNERGP